MNKDIAFRAESSKKIGIGHVMRCIALGQTLKNHGFHIHFITNTTSETINLRLKNENFNLHFIDSEIEKNLDDDAYKTLKICKEIEPLYIILDGYDFVTEYQKYIKNEGYKLICIDDIAHNHFLSDFVINQNISAEKKYTYSCEKYTKLLLGSRYVMLRKEFLKYTDWKRKIKKTAKNLLITLGGSDYKNITIKLLEYLELYKYLSLNIGIIKGEFFQYNNQIENFISEKPLFHNYRIYRSALNMPELIINSDLVISAGGSTVWELSFLQTPMILGIASQNQEMVVNELVSRNIAIEIGWLREMSSGKILNVLDTVLNNISIRKSLSKKAGKIVDGFGGERIINAILRDLAV